MKPSVLARIAERAAWLGVLCLGAASPGPAAAESLELATAGELPLEASGATQAAFEAALANQTLYLQTFINGVDSRMISPYRLIGGALYADASELRQLGFHIEEAQIGTGGRVDLSHIPGLVYRLDTLHQTVEITVGAEQLEPHRYDGSAETLRPTVSPGVALNYDFFAQEARADSAPSAEYTQQYSGLFDLRAFASPGELLQTAIVRRADPEPQGYAGALRLDSTLQHSDLDRLDTWRGGDVISGASLSWVTPVRLGGVQWQRNFRLQPNLVTFPVPSVRGSSAVPSTVDLLVNNVQQYSQQVPAGPFVIDNMPVITGQGEIRVVVRDAQGREQVTTMPFYAAPSLLKPGLVDYSVEAGYQRRNYAVTSNDYDSRPAALGSVRAGLADWLTLEGHAEGSGDLLNGGLGAVVKLGNAGVVSGSLAQSEAAGAAGSQWYASYQWSSAGFGAYASSQRGTAGYATLANLGLGAATTHAISQVSVTAAVAGGGLSLGYVAVEGGGVIGSPAGVPVPASETRLGTLSYSTSLRGAWTLYASVFREFQDGGSDGASLGLSYFLGNRTSFSASGQWRRGEASASLQASEPLPADGTGAGWRLQGSTGETGALGAGAGYRFGRATIEGGISDSAGGGSGFADLRGAVVSMDYRRWPLFTNPVYDGFALVDTGVPDVGVLHENRPVGHSNSDGLLLIPNLTSQSRNHIAIDARDVPLDADVESVREVAVPLDRAGVLVRFPVARADNLRVGLTLGDGTPVPLGATVTLNGGDSFVVGYDGEAYVKHVAARNVLLARWDEGACEAEFEYRAVPGAPRRLASLKCLPERQ